MKTMDDRADHRLPRLAPILLAAVLAWLVITRPGNLGGQDMPAYWLLTTLTAVAALAYSSWRFHGILGAAATITLLRFAEPAHPSNDTVLARGWDAIVLATMALGIGVGSRQGQSGPIPWVILTLTSAGIAFFGWYGYELPVTADQGITSSRLRHVAMALMAITVIVGLLAKKARWRERARLIAVAVLIPVGGIAATKPGQGDVLRLFDGGDWVGLSTEWRTAFRDGTWYSGAWCWTTPWVAVPLVLLGLWRTIARSRVELKHGQAPLAWLIAVAGIGALVAIGARPIAAGSLVLAAMGSLLSVFGIADQIQALKERIELKPPEQEAKQ